MKYLILRGDNKWLERQCSLEEFLQVVPFGVGGRSKLIPPLCVINSVFEQGEANAGMSGWYKWTAFSIEEKRYQELVVRLGLLGFRVPEKYPSWITNLHEWQIWKMEFLRNVPAELHLEKVKEIETLKNALKSNPMDKKAIDHQTISKEIQKLEADLSEWISRVAT